MMLRIAAADDDVIVMDEICGTIAALTDSAEQYTLTAYDNGKEFLWDLEKHRLFDIYLLDIEMPDYSGFQLAAAIRDVSLEAVIIFVTSHIEYAIDGYRYSAFRYIPKSKIQELLPQALKDAAGCVRNTDRRAYMIVTKDRIIRARYKDIVYIYVQGKYTYFKMLGGQIFKVRKPLSQVLSELDEEMFLLIDKGCAANIEHILTTIDHKANMRGGEKLDISRPKYKTFQEKINIYWGLRK